MKAETLHNPYSNQTWECYHLILILICINSNSHQRGFFFNERVELRVFYLCFLFLTPKASVSLSAELPPVPSRCLPY